VVVDDDDDDDDDDVDVDDDDDDDVDDAGNDFVVGEVAGSVLKMGLTWDEKYWISFCSKFNISRSTNNISRFECITSAYMISVRFSYLSCSNSICITIIQTNELTRYTTVAMEVFKSCA